jgi:hypothetical protein
VPEIGDAARYVMGVDVEALQKRVAEAAAGSPDSILADAVTLFEQDMRELAEFRRNPGSPEPEILIQARAAIAAAAEPALARASATRRPPVHLVVLVLIWLVLIGGPVAGEKLPVEFQTMLSTEVGTVALGLAITQAINQKRK